MEKRPYKRGRKVGDRTTTRVTINIDNDNLQMWMRLPNRSRWVNEILRKKFGGLK